MSISPLSIIIPVHGKWELTQACLRTLRQYPPHGGYEVIVIDNASNDATATELEPLGKALFGGAFVRIRNDRNANFAGACNQGARTARYDRLFFLNNDTLLLPDWDEPLMQALDADPALAAVGPLLLYEDGTVQHLGVAVYPDRSIHHFYTGIPSGHPLAGKRRNLSYITAAAMLIRAPLFFEAGMFHEGYVNGLEDVELCWKLRNAGHTLTVIPESRIYHLESRTRREAHGSSRNAITLNERCPTFRDTPEFHLIAQQDGYTPFLGPFFETFLRPAPERLAVYARMRVHANAARLEAILDQEVFWLDGYCALSALREAQGDQAGALDILVRASYHYPVMPVMDNILRLAAVADNEEITRKYTGLRDMALETVNNDNFFLLRRHAIRTTANMRDDTLLFSLIDEWDRQYGVD